MNRMEKLLEAQQSGLELARQGTQDLFNSAGRKVGVIRWHTVTPDDPLWPVAADARTAMGIQHWRMEDEDE